MPNIKKNTSSLSSLTPLTVEFGRYNMENISFTLYTLKTYT